MSSPSRGGVARTVANGTPVSPSILMRARSASRSRLISLTSWLTYWVTEMSLQLSITWLLVTASPFSLTTKAEPDDWTPSGSSGVAGWGACAGGLSAMGPVVSALNDIIEAMKVAVILPT